MSKARFFWYRHVQKMVFLAAKDESADTLQFALTRYAIREALEETRGFKDAAERIRLIETVYLRQTHTVTGAALALHVSERTATKWSTLFIYLVGEKMGFASEKEKAVWAAELKSVRLKSLKG